MRKETPSVYERYISFDGVYCHLYCCRHPNEKPGDNPGVTFWVMGSGSYVVDLACDGCGASYATKDEVLALLKDEVCYDTGATERDSRWARVIALREIVKARATRPVWFHAKKCKIHRKDGRGHKAGDRLTNRFTTERTLLRPAGDILRKEK